MPDDTILVQFFELFGQHPGGAASHAEAVALLRAQYGQCHFVRGFGTGKKTLEERLYDFQAFWL
jgi:hypothetical protein